MKSIFQPNQTSAALMVQFAEKRWGQEGDIEQQKRYLLLYDLYIKARSYAIINKLAFWLALLFALLVLLWPSLDVLLSTFGLSPGFAKSAIVQTTVTGLAALIYALYSHYKKRQMQMENLMRRIIYSRDNEQQLLEHALAEIERLDGGFSFGDSSREQEKQSEQ